MNWFKNKVKEEEKNRPTINASEVSNIKFLDKDDIVLHNIDREDIECCYGRSENKVVINLFDIKFLKDLSYILIDGIKIEEFIIPTADIQYTRTSECSYCYFTIGIEQNYNLRLFKIVNNYFNKKK